MWELVLVNIVASYNKWLEIGVNEQLADYAEEEGL